MENISKRKLKPNYKKTETNKKEEWLEVENKSKAGIKYTKFKRVLINK